MMLISVLLLVIYQLFYIQIFVLLIAMLMFIVSNKSPAEQVNVFRP
jgi:hypothetical protein